MRYITRCLTHYLSPMIFVPANSSDHVLHTRDNEIANLSRATLACFCDASNLTKADASILKIADINFAQ